MQTQIDSFNTLRDLRKKFLETSTNNKLYLLFVLCSFLLYIIKKKD